MESGKLLFSRISNSRDEMGTGFVDKAEKTIDARGSL
jgi:hypothetical protein